MPNKRLILWAGDGPLNARDEVVDFITKMIDLSLGEAEKDDTCWLNELVAYIICLNGVLREAGGDHLIVQRVEDWRRRALAAYDSIPNLTEKEKRDERPFIVSVFDDLNNLSISK